MEKKKNIALLFFGRINFCKKSFKTLKKAISFKENNIYTFLSSDNGSTEDLNDFIKLYKPVKYNNNEIKYKNNKLLKKMSNKPNMGDNFTNNIFKHFINRKRVTKLLIDYIYETNIHFDIIITLRADLYFSNKIELIFPLKENTIYYIIQYGNNINDQINYGDLNTMFKFNNVFNNLNYIDYYQTLNFKYPETLLYGNKDLYNIKYDRFNIGNFYIIRN